MKRRTSRILAPLAVLALGTAAALGGATGSVAAPTAAHQLSPSQRIGQRAGLQLAPKVTASTKASRTAEANPYVSTLPAGTKANYAGWQQKMAAKAGQRAASTARANAQRKATGQTKLAAPLLHDEEEPAGGYGSNDSVAAAEPVGAFGTGKRDNPRLRILGSLADLPVTTTPLTGITEDNGQLSTATDTKITGTGGVSATSVLGDGPHGTLTGDGSNDYDFYKVSSTAGLQITVDTRGTTAVDTIVGIYDATGTLLAIDDDGAGTFAGPSLLTFPVPTTGTYYALVAGFGPAAFPADPTDSGSGEGGNDEGAYSLKITAGPYDTDYYELDLAKGDVLGATVTGAGTLTVYRPDGTQMVGAPGVDASSLYPPVSPLPGGGDTTLAYVAEKTGRYAFRVDGSPGRYDATVEAYRPGSEVDPATRVQTVFLDFDGARVNTGIFGGPGVRTLSPFSAFVAKWGLNRSQEGVLIDKITAGVRENLQRDLAAKGLNDKLAVRVINSKDNADVFGAENVSRVIVGGTIEQSGVPTIGIAQYIDPGNYSHEDTALVLLDELSSADPTNIGSLNYYLRPGSDRVGFVSKAIANVTSHEIGHYIGNYHTDSQDAVHNLMDEGGSNFGQNLYGVGPDGIGGTRDDEDIDFRTDTYSLVEGFTGRENTLNVSAWAFVRGSRGLAP